MTHTIIALIERGLLAKIASSNAMSGTGLMAIGSHERTCGTSNPMVNKYTALHRQTKRKYSEEGDSSGKKGHQAIQNVKRVHHKDKRERIG